MPLRFAHLEIEHPVLLAPMAGYTDAVFRVLCLEQGAGAVYTELVSAEGLRRDSVKTQELLVPDPAEHPIAGHIFGRDPQAMAEAARYIEEQGCFDFIDVNCGCPVRKVVSRGAGAALTKDPQQIERIVKAIRAAVSMPVTVKTRIGFGADSDNHLDIARAAEAGGAAMLAVHGRFATKVHSGPVDYGRIAAMKQAISIPLIANGGIESAEDADRMLRETGADGVMVGRGAMGNLWIFREIISHWQQEAYAGPSLEERREIMARHLRGLIGICERNDLNAHSRKLSATPEERACKMFRVHLVKYLKGMRGRRGLMQTFDALTDFESIMAAVDSVLEQNR